MLDVSVSIANLGNQRDRQGLKRQPLESTRLGFEGFPFSCLEEDLKDLEIWEAEKFSI